VLADFSRAEQKELPDLRIEAANAVEEILANGLTAAMNRFNKKKDSEDKEDKQDKQDQRDRKAKPARSNDAP